MPYAVSTLLRSVVLIGLTRMHKTGCSVETRLFLLMISTYLAHHELKSIKNLSLGGLCISKVDFYVIQTLLPFSPVLVSALVSACTLYISLCHERFLCRR